MGERRKKNSLSENITYTHTFYTLQKREIQHVYMFLCVCVCVRARACVCVCVCAEALLKLQLDTARNNLIKVEILCVCAYFLWRPHTQL